jgi:hypothetical protein
LLEEAEAGKTTTIKTITEISWSSPKFRPAKEFRFVHHTNNGLYL